MKLNEMNLSEGAREMMTRRQQLSWAVKRLMGFPINGAANDSVQMLGGHPAGVSEGMRIGSIAAKLDKDCIYLGFKNPASRKFAQISLAFRDEWLVDWRLDLQPYASDQDSPVMLVDVGRGGRFERGERNMLVFREGVPKDLARGRRIAMARIRSAAAEMPARISASSTWVPPEASPSDHLPQGNSELFVRLV